MASEDSAISTHVLDLTTGRPAQGVPVGLERSRSDGGWEPVGDAVTDDDGRVEDLAVEAGPLAAGTYRLTFDTGAYFESRDRDCFHPRVQITFRVDRPDDYHVPLLLSRYGYTTYRGS